MLSFLTSEGISVLHLFNINLNAKNMVTVFNVKRMVLQIMTVPNMAKLPEGI
jgi:hypothetical protein